MERGAHSYYSYTHSKGRIEQEQDADTSTGAGAAGADTGSEQSRSTLAAEVGGTLTDLFKPYLS